MDAAKRARVAPLAKLAPAVGVSARLAADNITLALVLGCLDTRSILSCRRVSRLWRSASLKPEAWLDAGLTINADQLVLVPPSSLCMLQRLRLVRDTRYVLAHFDPAPALACLRHLPRLFMLQLQDMIVHPALCSLISANAPQLRELDLRTCNEFDQADPASVREHERQMLCVYDGKPRADPNEAMNQLALPDNCALTLRLPHLTSLKTHYMHSMRHVASLLDSLPPLRVLDIDRRGSAWWYDSSDVETHFVGMLRYAFGHKYAESVQQLTLANTNTVGYDSLSLPSLTALLRLSIVQTNDTPAVTQSLLESIARDMPQLQACEICVSCSRVMRDPQWWVALASVRVLTAFGATGSAVKPEFKSVALQGLARVLSGPQLQRLELRSSVLSLHALLLGHAHLHTLCIASENLSHAFVDGLAAMPQLTSLEITFHPRQADDEAFDYLAHKLVRLRALSLNGAFSHAGYVMSLAAWRSLATMPSLTLLALKGTGALTDAVVDQMRGQLASKTQADDREQQRALGVFLSRPGSPGLELHAPASALCQLRLTNSMITPAQLSRLLQSRLYVTVVRDLISFVVMPPASRVTPQVIYCSHNYLDDATAWHAMM